MSSTCNHPIRYIRLLSDKHHADTQNDTWLNITPEFQREYEQRPMPWIANLLDSILQDRAMPPVWTVFNEYEDSDEVLDGQHRLLTILKFINNEIKVKDPSRERIHNKFFKELNKSDQQKILNYPIYFNKLDGNYRKSPQKLFEMYDILNRSSKPLNVYEVYKPLRVKFYRILESKLPKIKGSPLFSEKDNKRGAFEMRLIQMLALCDIDFQPMAMSFPWNSMEMLKDLWCQKWIGDTDENIQLKMSLNQRQIEDLIEKIFNSIFRFNELGLFLDEHKQNRVDKRNQLIFQMIVAFTVKIFDKDKRAYKDIIDLGRKIFNNISTYAETEARDQKYQKNCIRKIYNDLLAIKNHYENRRLFPKDMIEQKLKEQRSICPLCDDSIQSFQSFEGDHIIPFCQGGATIYENLRVVHSVCHRH